MKKSEVNEDIVRLAYQLILGRNAESNEVVKAHLQFLTIDQLRKHMMNSPEFKAKLLQAQFSSGSKWVSVDVLGCFTQWVDLHDRYISHSCLNNDMSQTKLLISFLNLELETLFLILGPISDGSHW